MRLGYRKTVQTLITMLRDSTHPGGPQSMGLDTWMISKKGEKWTLVMTRGMSREAMIGRWEPSVWMSAADKCVKESFMQGLPVLQHPLWWMSNRLTLPVQEQRCHPMPLLPKSIMVSMAIAIVICDSLFMCFVSVLTRQNNYYCVLLSFLLTLGLGMGNWEQVTFTSEERYSWSSTSSMKK